MIRRFALSLLLISLSATCGWAIDFDIPIRCDYGNDCYIQNYVDLDPSKNRREYECGSLTYDGHKGTDFRVPWADYQRGVEVLAAASGVVLRVRDGIEDRDARGRLESVEGYEVGNGVIIKHGDGYETVYAHMKQGSIRVKPGDTVQRGQVLGLVGLSGLTTFSHLHFGVKFRGKPVCPFKGAEGNNQAECGSTTGTLWSPDALADMDYIPTGLLQAGFAGYVPKLPEIVRTKLDTTIDAKAPVLVFAVVVFGVQAGDEVRARVTTPAGEVFTETDKVIPKNQAQRLLFVGKKLGKRTSWPPGEYHGEYQLVRRGEEILNVTREVLVR